MLSARAALKAVREVTQGRHVKAALSAMTVKTDRKDARRDCPVDPDGMVPPGARKVDRSSRDSGAAGCAQAATWAAHRCGIAHSRDLARLRPEGWLDYAEEFRSADPRVGYGSGNVGTHWAACGVETSRIRRGSAGNALRQWSCLQADPIHS